MNIKKIIIIVTIAVLAAALVTASAFVFLFIPSATNSNATPPSTAGIGIQASPTAPSTTTTGLTIDNATIIAQNYVTQLGNSNLSVAEVDQYSTCFYARVVETNTDAGAFELTINNVTGTVTAEQGAMMEWNTKYGISSSTGMMGYLETGTTGGMMGSGGMMTWLRGTPTTTMSITTDQAKTAAQQYLNTNYPGTTIGQATTFYGYYMMQVQKGTSYYGMITVNGQTGQVLYCSWLGTFMQRMVIG
jgi:flagellar basal body-associated protein FliL